MHDNPYSPPNQTEGDAIVNRFASGVMASLSALLGVAMLGMAAPNVVVTLNAMAHLNGHVSPYLVARAALMLSCASALLYSAVCWTSGRSRIGLYLLIGAMAMFSVGNWLLLRLVPL